jgi:drug/metabolite transporter (DMT)-like permease
MRSFTGALLLLATTFIWGTAFLAQKFGADHLGPVSFTVLRNVLGGLFVLAVASLRAASRRSRPSGTPEPDGRSTRRSVLAGVFCGVPLFFAMTAQQVGVTYTTPGICAFLTTNYVLFVPILASLAAWSPPRAHVCLGAALALAGTYLICLTGEGAAQEGFAGIGKGELWSLACALLFAVQMMAVDRFAQSSDLLVMSMSQLFTCALVGAPFMFLLPSEAAKLSLDALRAAAMPLVYCGVFSSGIAYTLQNVAQSRTSASIAAIVLSTESVFGALSGWLVLGDVLSAGQLCGCALVFAAVAATQLLAGRTR